ncbi:hypothetical protein N0V91_004707 [Didymella pomorum]|uniref:1,3-beta-glucanosyltransferase n=1 Tax=Didymella pomorum TaxID=749634 RepID=A0A9W8ZI29_9PLEO|nr:hypothetical protein N0V91_004707 [Didymella pomorum]
MDFFDCGNETVAADFYSFAVTGLCSDIDFATSSFTEIVDMAGNFDVPVFMADNTCSGSRSFLDQPWVIEKWSDRLSGNVLTEWYNFFTTSEEVSELSFENYTDNAVTGTPSLPPAYSALSSQWATLLPSAIKRARPTSATDCALNERAGTDIPTLGLSGLTTATPPSAKNTGTADDANSSDEVNLAAILGGVFGGVVGLILIVVAFFRLRQRKGPESSTAPASKDSWSDKEFDKPSD